MWKEKIGKAVKEGKYGAEVRMLAEERLRKMVKVEVEVECS